MVPAKERKTYDELKRYIRKYNSEPDIAWTDAFPGASAWLADRDIARVQKEKNEPDNPHGLGSF